jgi:hypothetical protein
MTFSQGHPGPVYDQTFDGKVRSALVDALGQAYETATELHVPARGSNERTFGYGLYEFAVHELGQVARALPEQLSIASMYPSFRLGVGDFELACHRVGRSVWDDIYASFPNAESAAYTMVEEQLWLPHVVRHVGLENARRLVLAHMGNPEESLRAVYLCIPGRTQGTRIVEWAFAEALWVADRAESVGTLSAPRPAAEEVVEEPVIRRKDKKAREHEG